MHEYKGCIIPDDLFYDLDYLWIRPEGDNVFTIGLTDPAQTMAGRLQYLIAKKPGTHRVAGKAIARLESGKWAGGIPAPFDGTVLSINPKIQEQPNFVNVDPYGDAWIATMQADNPKQALDQLTTGSDANQALEKWIDKYDVQCMRCTQ